MPVQPRLAVVGTVALGVALMPLGAWAMVTFGPGLPVLACALGLIALPFGIGRQVAVPVMKARPWGLVAWAVGLAFIALGLAYLALASESIARLSGAALAVGVAVALLWLRHYGMTRQLSAEA